MTLGNTQSSSGNVHTTVRVCCGHSCSSHLSEYSFDRACAELDIDNPQGGVGKNGIAVEKSPCQGNCEKAPTVVVTGKNGESKTYSYMTPVEIGKLIKNLRSF